MEVRHREEAHAREMFAMIERYVTSQLSHSAFCKQERISPARFNYWLQRYRQRETPATQTVTLENKDATDQALADFIPLRITPAEPAASSSTCEIEFPSGVVIRFQDAVDASVLVQFIRAEQAEP